MANGKDRISIEHRITSLEGEIGDVAKDVTSIKDNHLPHIRQQIEAVDDKVDKISWKVGTVIGFGAMVGSAILSKFVDAVLASVR